MPPYVPPAMKSAWRDFDQKNYNEIHKNYASNMRKSTNMNAPFCWPLLLVFIVILFVIWRLSK